MTQSEIIQGCKRGREDAYRQLVDTYAARLMGLCMRYLRDHQKAEDAVQETYIQVFKSIHRIDTDSEIMAWMSRIAINTCLKELRKNKMLVFQMEDSILENIPEVQLEETWTNADELLTLMDNIPPAYRIIFNLHVIEGYSHREISQMLKIRESNSRTKLTRARKMIQDYLVVQTKKSIV